MAHEPLVFISFCYFYFVLSFVCDNIKIYVQENDVQQFPIMLQSLGENTLETGFLMTWLKFSCATRTT